MNDDTRQLRRLLADWAEVVAGTSHPQPPVYDGPDVTLTRLTEKTAEVDEGAAFIARVRTTSDGHPYIGKAIDNGARLIVAQRPPSAIDVTIPDDVVYLQVDDTAETEAWLAAAWEGFPSRELVMIGITGTDGKTTTANYLFSILEAAGVRAGLLSTIKAVVGGTEEPLELHVTTPEAPVVQRYLRRMVDAGLTHCVLEATSHGLAQHRVSAVDLDIAAVTNITHEHLDYHGSYEAYFAAKQRLFAMLQDDPWQIPSGNPAKTAVRPTAVLNHDDSSFGPLAASLRGERPVAQLAYGLDPTCDYWAADIVYGPQTTRFVLHESAAPETTTPIATTQVGAFNVYNMLAASATARALGLPHSAIAAGLGSVTGLSGRMERVDRGQPFLVIVDFAHTPNALERAIGAARQMLDEEGDGRILTVFGSAGKRDVEKRRLMAEIAARDADLTVLTAEDPRTESLDEILTMMATAAESQGGVEGETFWRVADRGQAIYRTLALARPGDIVLICGKGHEQSMCFGVTEYPWDDRDATQTALDALLSGRPMVDMGLPTFGVNEINADH